MLFAWFRHAVPWDSGRGSGTLSHGKGSAPAARLEFRRFVRSVARTFAPSLARRRAAAHRSGFTGSGWSERREDPVRPFRSATRQYQRRILRASEIPPVPRIRWLSFSLTISVLRHAAGREISLARDTHFSRLTVVEGREITTAERKGSQPR